MGSGAVCHTVNPRLSDKDIKYIINDAQVSPNSQGAMNTCCQTAASGNCKAHALLPPLGWLRLARCHSSIIPLSPVPVAGPLQDFVLLSDITFAAQLERVVPECPSLKAVVFLTDRWGSRHITCAMLVGQQAVQCTVKRRAA